MAAKQYDSPIPTGVRLTHFDPEFRKNPYPILAELRERDPIHRDTELGRWVFTRHDDVWEILRNPEYWSDPRKGNPDSFARRFLGSGDEEPSMLLMDNPGHRRLRELARHPFTPRAVEVWRERARTVAKRHVSAIEEDEFDLISAVANPIPTVVIAELLGVDPERHSDFKRWSDAVIKTAFSPISSEEDTKRADEARESLFSFFLEEIEKRRRAPADDLITKMVQAEESGDHLTDEEISLQCNLLLLAGNLTTSDLIGNAVMALVSNPDQQERLRADRSLMKKRSRRSPALRFPRSSAPAGLHIRTSKSEASRFPRAIPCRRSFRQRIAIPPRTRTPTVSTSRAKMFTTSPLGVGAIFVSARISLGSKQPKRFTRYSIVSQCSRPDPAGTNMRQMPASVASRICRFAVFIRPPRTDGFLRAPGCGMAPRRASKKRAIAKRHTTAVALLGNPARGAPCPVEPRNRLEARALYAT